MFSTRPVLFGRATLQMMPSSVPSAVWRQTEKTYEKVMAPWLEHVQDEIRIEVHPNTIANRRSLRDLLKEGDRDVMALFKLGQRQLIDFLTKKSEPLTKLLDKVRFNDLMLLTKRERSVIAAEAKLTPEQLQKHFNTAQGGDEVYDMIHSDFLKFIDSRDFSALCERNEDDHIAMRDHAFIYRKGYPPQYETPKNFKGGLLPPLPDDAARKARWTLHEMSQDPDESRVDFARHVMARAIRAFPAFTHRVSPIIADGGKERVRMETPDTESGTSAGEIKRLVAV
jgi:hypothetical protein